MSSGQAPLLMLDLATSHMRDRQRATRGLISRSAIRKSRAAKVVATRAR
ncbi:MAG: hypothetical protein WBQ50_11630 [Nocardioides sp.]